MCDAQVKTQAAKDSAEAAELRQQLDAMRVECESAKAELAVAKQTASQAEAEVQRYTSEVATMRMELTNARAETAAAEEAEELANKAAEAAAQADQSELVSQLQAQLNAARRDAEAHKDKEAALRSGFQKQVDDLKAEVRGRGGGVTIGGRRVWLTMLWWCVQLSERDMGAKAMAAMNEVLKKKLAAVQLSLSEAHASLERNTEGTGLRSLLAGTVRNPRGPDKHAASVP